MAKNKVEQHKLKCLVCGEFFFKTDQEYKLAVEESKDVSKHPDDYQHKITCPKCKSDKVQLLITNKTIVKNKFENIKQQYNSISSFIGGTLGSIIATFVILLEENQFVALKAIFKFFSFIAAIYILSKLFYLPPLISSTIMLIYTFFNKKEGR